MSIKLVQEKLRAAGFDPGAPDGVWGRRTETALDAALATARRGGGRTLDASTFFAGVRRRFGALSQAQVNGFNVLLAALADWPVSWIAYALATTWHETAGTMQPIKERGGDAYFRRMYDIEGDRPAKARELGNLTPGDGVRYAGRGYVQLTGRINYERYGLVARPDDAMKPDVAAAILKEGMAEGRFTGKALRDYLPGDYVAARRIINGLDKAREIAGRAVGFEASLREAGL